MRIRLALLPLAACFLLLGSNARAVTGTLNFVVLRVTFSDFGTGTRFTTPQTQSMDAEYPAQTGVFFKQAGKAFPDWLPPAKYKNVSPPAGGSVGLLVEERSPETDPDFQAIKAGLTFGGQQIYYLINARRRILGDDTATTHGPNGIPDEGVLIERVVEGRNPALSDPCGTTTCPRWVEVRGNGGPDNLWSRRRHVQELG